jgi:hypothetical protein
MKKSPSCTETGSGFDAASVRAIVLNIFRSNPEVSRICSEYGKSQMAKSHPASDLQGTPTRFFSHANSTTNTPNRTHTMANYKTCTHIKITGHRCGSPALRGERFCYFHQHVHRGVRRRSTSRMHPIALFESEEALQVSLMEVVNALLYDGLDLKRATLILRALHIAVKNARRVRLDIRENEMVTEVPEETPDAAPTLFHVSDMELPISAAAILDENPTASKGSRIQNAYKRAIRTEEILQKQDEARRMNHGAACATARPAVTTERVAPEAVARRDNEIPTQPQAQTTKPSQATAAPGCSSGPDSPGRSTESKPDNPAPRKPAIGVKNPPQQQKPKARASGS